MSIDLYKNKILSKAKFMIIQESENTNILTTSK